MQRFVLIAIPILVVSPFLVSLSLLPEPAKLLPEVLSLIAALCVIVAGVDQRFRFVPVKYWLVFGLMAIWIVCGVLANAVGTGPIVAGARTYLRALPFFFLPAVFNFQDVQIRHQVKLILALSLMQVPLAIAQRYIILSERRYTGDPVFGTLMLSSNLSIYLICVVCVLVGMFIRGRISKPIFIMLFMVLLVPTMINETKATLLLVPLGVLAAFVIGSPPRKRLGVVIVSISLIVSFIAIFIPVYDAMNVYAKHRPPIASLYTEEGRLEELLNKDVELGTTEHPGRFDAVIVPLRYVLRDPVHVVFGLGIGNVSESALGKQFTGEYFQKFVEFSYTSTAVFLLELGVGGAALIFLVYWLIFRDALAVARIDNKGLRGAIAVGWCGVTAVMALASFYKSPHNSEALAYLYWYFSGLVATWRVRMALGIADNLAYNQAARTRVAGPTNAAT